MKKLAFIVVLLFVASLANADCIVDLTKKQIKNLDTIVDLCQVQYPNFGGFYSTSEGIRCVGVDDPVALKSFIDAIDLDNVDLNKRKKAIKRAQNKLRAIGLDDDDFKAMNLTY